MHTVFLKYVDEVARQHSIRRAASVLNVSSTTVNRKIIAVEQQLGVRLFERTPEGVELTSVGRVMVEHCRRTLYDFEQVRVMIEDIRDLRSGHLSIWAIDAFAGRILPGALTQFAEQYPGISVSVVSGEPEEIDAAVQDGRGDIGVTFVNSLAPGLRALSERLAPIGAVMRPDHPLAERASLRVEDLQGYPLIRSLDAQIHASMLDREAEGLALSTYLYVNNHNLAKAAVMANKGIGVYTRVGFLDEIESGALRFVQIAGSALSENRIGWVVSQSAGIGPAKHMFASCLDRAVRSLNLAG